MVVGQAGSPGKHHLGRALSKVAQTERSAALVVGSFLFMGGLVARK